MLFMVPTLILAALCADPRIDGPGFPEAGREQALDSLASSILLLGDIPEAPDMLILTAWRGWPGRIGYIEIIPADADSGSTGLPPGQSDVWGAAGSGTGLARIRGSERISGSCAACFSGERAVSGHGETV